MDNDLRKNIILDNYNNANCRKRHDDDNNYKKINTRIDTCIDNIDLYLKFNDVRLEDITFDGEACVISTSSANIMSNLIKGKSLDEILDIMDNYFKMIRGEDYDSSKLGDSIVYDNIKNQPNRIKCATLSWNGVYKEIMKYREELEDK